LWGSGFTDRLVSPFEDRTLLALGLGITNLCARTTARAEHLDEQELRRGARRLTAKVRRYRPEWVAFLGVGAYRAAFGRPRAGLGPQTDRLGPARVWVLPNPSGLNAHYGLADLVEQFAALRQAVRPRFSG
jgi:TDG/mug DNA glycosylase family protein